MGQGTPTRILITDDNEQLVALLSIRLGRLNYKTDTATTALKGYELALKNNYDLIILDIIMPKHNGLEICKNLRSHGILSPILMLSGRTDKTTIVKCLDAGADDYITKPFNHKELTARVAALLRRNKKTFAARFIRRGEVELDTTSDNLRMDKNHLQLTRTESLLLQCLMNFAPEIVARETLLEEVWGIGDKHSSNRLEVYIRRLRSKLKKHSGSNYIHTARGKGYYFGEA